MMLDADAIAVFLTMLGNVALSMVARLIIG
jgi:hypothetical protein